MTATHRFRLIVLIVLFLLSTLGAQGTLAQTTPVCPLTQGYWANHPESWPTTSLMLGVQSYTQAELLALMPGGGTDASTILAVQLIAAKLNIAAGADPAAIGAALLTADSLLGQFVGKLPYNVAPTSAQGEAMVNVAGLLDSFNNGLLTPGCALTATATLTPTTEPPTATPTPSTAPPTATSTSTPTVTLPVTPGTPTPTLTPTLAPSCPNGILLNSFMVAYGGRVYDPATNQTTFTYLVCGTGVRPDLSHFDVEIPVCAPPLIIVGTNPTEAVQFGVDPTTGVNGIKWDQPLQTTASRTYSITFTGNVVEGTVQVAVKGDGFQIGSLPGPSCVVGALNVDKFVSTDGVNWDDAGEFPGPQVEVGAQVRFRFVLTNIGNVELSTLTLSDNVYDTSSCALPATLQPGTSHECIIGPFTAVEGQHTNTATASGVFSGQTTSSSDVAHYFSGDLPLVDVEKLVSADGGVTWVDNVEVQSGGAVSFKFILTNTGNVALGSFTLSDSAFDASSCALPASLEPAASFECIIGPFPATDTAHTNTVTVSAVFEGQTVTATDTASYHPDDGEEEGAIIIVEGPVEAININIITIFGTDIEVDINDPILTRIRIGDNIRVEGDLVVTGDTLIIVAVTIINIDIDLVVIGQPPAAPGFAFYVPPGCKITGIGNNNPHLKCSGRDT